MANAETTRTDSGGPYKRERVVFAANQPVWNFEDALRTPHSSASLETDPPGGVHVAQVLQDSAAPSRRYDPGHPDAGQDGYVDYPDIDPLTEMVDLMGATRAYGLNSSAIQAEKEMINSALDIAKG